VGQRMDVVFVPATIRMGMEEACGGIAVTEPQQP
jgi:hypothetical protein